MNAERHADDLRVYHLASSVVTPVHFCLLSRLDIRRLCSFRTRRAKQPGTNIVSIANAAHERTLAEARWRGRVHFGTRRASGETPPQWAPNRHASLFRRQVRSHP